MTPALLPFDLFEAIYQAAGALGLGAAGLRRLLWEGIEGGRDLVRQGETAAADLRHDLVWLNQTPDFAGGVPLRRWLSNAYALAWPRRGAAILGEALTRLDGQARAAPWGGDDLGPVGLIGPAPLSAPWPPGARRPVACLELRLDAAGLTVTGSGLPSTAPLPALDASALRADVRHLAAFGPRRGAVAQQVRGAAEARIGRGLAALLFGDPSTPTPAHGALAAALARLDARQGFIRISLRVDRADLVGLPWTLTRWSGHGGLVLGHDPRVAFSLCLPGLPARTFAHADAVVGVAPRPRVEAVRGALAGVSSAGWGRPATVGSAQHLVEIWRRTHGALALHLEEPATVTAVDLPGGAVVHRLSMAGGARPWPADPDGAPALVVRLPLGTPLPAAADWVEAGVEALLDTGAPTLVTSRAPLSPEAAATVTAVFWAALADGAAIDLAAQQARHALAGGAHPAAAHALVCATRGGVHLSPFGLGRDPRSLRLIVEEAGGDWRVRLLVDGVAVEEGRIDRSTAERDVAHLHSLSAADEQTLRRAGAELTAAVVPASITRRLLWHVEHEAPHGATLHLQVPPALADLPWEAFGDSEDDPLADLGVLGQLIEDAGLGPAGGAADDRPDLTVLRGAPAEPRPPRAAPFSLLVVGAPGAPSAEVRAEARALSDAFGAEHVSWRLLAEDPLPRLARHTRGAVAVHMVVCADSPLDPAVARRLFAEVECLALSGPGATPALAERLARVVPRVITGPVARLALFWRGLSRGDPAGQALEMARTPAEALLGAGVRVEFGAWCRVVACGGPWGQAIAQPGEQAAHRRIQGHPAWLHMERAAERAAIEASLAFDPVVVVQGPKGAGKSALMVHVAAALAEEGHAVTWLKAPVTEGALTGALGAPRPVVIIDGAHRGWLLEEGRWRPPAGWPAEALAALEEERPEARVVLLSRVPMGWPTVVVPPLSYAAAGRIAGLLPTVAGAPVAAWWPQASLPGDLVALEHALQGRAPSQRWPRDRQPGLPPDDLPALIAETVARPAEVLRRAVATLDDEAIEVTARIVGALEGPLPDDVLLALGAPTAILRRLLALGVTLRTTEGTRLPAPAVTAIGDRLQATEAGLALNTRLREALARYMLAAAHALLPPSGRRALPVVFLPPPDHPIPRLLHAWRLALAVGDPTTLVDYLAIGMAAKLASLSDVRSITIADAPAAVDRLVLMSLLGPDAHAREALQLALAIDDAEGAAQAAVLCADAGIRDPVVDAALARPPAEPAVRALHRVVTAEPPFEHRPLMLPAAAPPALVVAVHLGLALRLAGEGAHDACLEVIRDTLARPGLTGLHRARLMDLEIRVEFDRGRVDTARICEALAHARGRRRLDDQLRLLDRLASAHRVEGDAPAALRAATARVLLARRAGDRHAALDAWLDIAFDLPEGHAALRDRIIAEVDRRLSGLEAPRLAARLAWAITRFQTSVEAGCAQAMALIRDPSTPSGQQVSIATTLMSVLLPGERYADALALAGLLAERMAPGGYSSPLLRAEVAGLIAAAHTTGLAVSQPGADVDVALMALGEAERLLGPMTMPAALCSAARLAGVGLYLAVLRGERAEALVWLERTVERAERAAASPRSVPAWRARLGYPVANVIQAVLMVVGDAPLEDLRPLHAAMRRVVQAAPSPYLLGATAVLSAYLSGRLAEQQILEGLDPDPALTDAADHLDAWFIDGAPGPAVLRLFGHAMLVWLRLVRGMGDAAAPIRAVMLDAGVTIEGFAAMLPADDLRVPAWRATVHAGLRQLALELDLPALAAPLDEG